MSDVKVMVGIPFSEKPLSMDVFLAWMRLAATGVDVIAGRGPTPLARHNLAASFLANPEFTHLLMLDLDHVHDVDIIARLARWLDTTPKPKIIGGLNYQREAPYSPCVFMFQDDSLGTKVVTGYGPGGLIEVDAIGMGCVLIAREVLEAIGEPYFQFAYVGKRFVGEDIWFCHQAHRAGYKVWCDTTLHSPHQGDHLVSERQFREWMAANRPNNPEETIDSTIVEEVGRPACPESL